jgi:hypothetical protein
MRDGAAAGHLARRPACIHVDPVVIAGDVGERVDRRLGDRTPGRRAERAPGPRGEIARMLHVDNGHGHPHIGMVARTHAGRLAIAG